MKIALLIFAVFTGLTIASLAQTNSISPVHADKVQISPWLREVNGELYNARFSTNFTEILAVVEQVYTNGIQLYWAPRKPVYRTLPNGGVTSVNFISGGASRIKVGEEVLFQKEILLVDYPTNRVAAGQKLATYAMQTGTTNFAGSTMELWDCGSPPGPDLVKQVETEAAQEQSLLEKERKEKLRAMRSNEYAVQARTVRWLQSQATNGSSSAQCSLGLHYFKGQGCETNRELAIYWLKKAAGQGDTEAKDTLARMKP